MKDLLGLIAGNWKSYAIAGGVALLIGLASGGAAGYKIGAWMEHDVAYNEGVAAQKLTETNQTLEATQNAVAVKGKIENEVKKLKNPDIVKRMYDNGWMRSPDDL